MSPFSTPVVVEQWPPNKPAHWRVVGADGHGICSMAVWQGRTGAEQLADLINAARPEPTDGKSRADPNPLPHNLGDGR